MKKILFKIFLIVPILFSCNKFLDTKPVDTLTPENYYNTEEQLNTALIGVYDIIGQADVYGDAMFDQLGACTDEGWYARSAKTSGMAVYNFNYSDDDVRRFWRALYVGIERANLLISNINKPAMDEEKRKNILGEALFLRAYYHFLLVSNFGDVPLLITPTASVNNTSIARTPSVQVYQQVIKDMTDAEGMVNKSSVIGNSSRISKTIVEGILARVNLYMAGYPLQDRSKYADALAWAKKVQQSGEHTLNPSFSQIFINQAQNIYDVKESMWEADFLGNRTDAYTETGRIGNTNGIAYTASPSFAQIGYSYGFINVTGKLYSLYEPTDTRRDWCIAPYYYSGANQVIWPASMSVYNRNCGKWRRSFELQVSGGKNQNFTPQNFPILRYADVLLMLAEAENEVNGPTTIAHAALNQVRARAGASMYGGAATITNAASFRKIIQDERARELCFEALRRPDLIRWGIFIQIMRDVATQFAAANPTGGIAYGVLGYNNISERNVLFPIPASELSVNHAMTQNTGW